MAGVVDKRQAVSPSDITGGAFQSPVSDGKGGCIMVTYSDLIQIGILIVSIISLFFQVNNKKK